MAYAHRHIARKKKYSPKHITISTKPVKAVKGKKAMSYKEFVATIKTAAPLFAKRSVAPGVLTTINTAIREFGLDPKNVTVIIDMSAWGGVAAWSIRDAKRLQQKRKEEEAEIQRLRDGVYDSIEVMGGGVLHPKAASPWEYMPLLLLGKAKTKRQKELKNEMNLLGNYLTEKALRGSNILFPEIKRGRKILRIKDARKALELSGTANREHTIKMVQLADFMFKRYRHLLDRRDLPASVKKTIRLSGQIAKEGKALGYHKTRLDMIPKEFPFMMFSREMQKVVTKKKKPKLALLKILQFYAGTVEQKSRQ